MKPLPSAKIHYTSHNNPLSMNYRAKHSSIHPYCLINHKSCEIFTKKVYQVLKNPSYCFYFQNDIGCVQHYCNEVWQHCTIYHCILLLRLVVKSPLFLLHFIQHSFALINRKIRESVMQTSSYMRQIHSSVSMQYSAYTVLCSDSTLALNSE